jgi:uncharacterized protein
MTSDNAAGFTAFSGSRRIAAGSLEALARSVRSFLARDKAASVLVFEDSTGRQIELDLRGSDDEVVRRLADHPLVGQGPARERRPGRPKLGVVPREVTLLPRHWEWLNRQPGGASVALRKLVEEARRAHGTSDRQREAREATYRIMSAMAGNEPGYEEAVRVLFAGDHGRFRTALRNWPADLRDYLAQVAEAAFPSAANDKE